MKRHCNAWCIDAGHILFRQFLELYRPQKKIKSSLKVDLGIVFVRVEFERELLKGFPDLPVVGILKNILMFFLAF